MESQSDTAPPAQGQDAGTPVNGNGKNGGILSAPRQDFLASIVVFLVALPLCMGIAIASGVPVAAGLITGIVGGAIVGWLSGAPLQVSGPAAGLTVIVYDIVQKHGLEVLGIAVLIGGTIQLLAGLLRYGRWFRAVSPAVIYGMLAGIGVLILSSQFHVMVDDAPKGSGLTNLISIPEAIKKGLPMPEMGTAEQRRAQRDMLQQFGALHEQQVQLRESASEIVPVEDPAEPAAVTPVADEQPEPPDPARFEELAARQLALNERFSALRQQSAELGIIDDVRDPEAMTAALQAAQQSMDNALEDLRRGVIDHVRTSQANAQQSLESIQGNLKNHDWAAKVGMLTILVLIAWKAVVPARLKLIPAPLVAIVVATAATAALTLPVLYVEVPDNLWSEVHFPSWTVIQSAPLGAIIQGGIVLAVVASAETLLCATAVDQMQTHARTRYDRELTAQGVGNMVCGLLGALPMTGVIVRSAANVEAGARSRLSTILHGCWLLVFVSMLAFVLRMIPTAALAAMLVYIGYKLVDVKAIGKLRKYGWGEVAIYFATLGMIVCTDLLTGVLTGIALSALKLLHTFSHLHVDLQIDEPNRKAVLNLEGAATFVRLPVLAAKLEEVPPNVELHVNFEELTHVDHACLDLLMNWAKQHEGTGGTLAIDWDSLHANFRDTPSKNHKSGEKTVA